MPSEVTLLELVYAYAALSNGLAVKPRYIDQIIDSDQAVLLQPKTERLRILDDTVVEDIRRLLAAVMDQAFDKEENISTQPPSNPSPESHESYIRFDIVGL